MCRLSVHFFGAVLKWMMQSLTELNLQGCRNLESLPERIRECKALKTLMWTPKLESLPDSIGDLTSLTELGLSYCGLVTLSERIGDLTSLTKLNLNSCWNLASLPERIGDAQHWPHSPKVSDSVSP